MKSPEYIAQLARLQLLASVIADSESEIRQCLVHTTVSQVMPTAGDPASAELDQDAQLMSKLLTAAEDIAPLVASMRARVRERVA